MQIFLILHSIIIFNRITITKNLNNKTIKFFYRNYVIGILNVIKQNHKLINNFMLTILINKK